MTTTPRIGAPELVSGQATPETTVNEQIRYVEQGASYFIAKDKDLATPPGSPADGDCYIVAASPTGAWSGKATKLAFYESTAWVFITPIEGTRAYLQDENTVYEYSGAAWGAPAGVYSPGGTDVALDDGGTGASLADPNADRILFWDDSAGQVTWLAASDGLTISGTTITATLPVSTQSGTSYTAVLGDGNTYIQFTSASAVAFTIPPNASVAFAVGTVIVVEQNGAGVVTLTAGAGVTLNSRGALLNTAGQYAVAQVKKVASNTWTVIGDVA